VATLKQNQKKTLNLDLDYPRKKPASHVRAGFVETTENWGFVLISGTKAGKILYMENGSTDLIYRCRCINYNRVHIRIKVGDDGRHWVGRREGRVERERFDFVEE